VSNWTKLHAVVFFIGFTAFVVALGFGATSGAIWDLSPMLVNLRSLGVGFMLAGLVLWIMQTRAAAGKPELNPFFGFLAVVGIAAVLVSVLFPGSGLSPVLNLAGMGAAAVALIIGLLVMAVNPAYPEPLSTVWPGGPAKYPGPDAKAFNEAPPDAHHAAHATPEPAAGPADDDLTVIEGVGPRTQEVLYQAGIRTFSALIGKSGDEVKGLLRANGYKAPVDATSWSAQAELAAQGQWDALKDLQSRLTAGRG